MEPTLERPIYGIDERPPTVWESWLYGWQHTLVDISPFVLPLAVAAAVGMSAPEQAQLINNCLLAMGLATLIQTTLGNRLPIIQGPSATVTAALAPVGAQLGAAAMWGGAFVGALIETAIGASRILGFLRRFLPLAVSGVVIVAIAFSLGQLAVRLAIGDGRPINAAFVFGVIALICLLQVGLGRFGRGIVGRGAIFFSIWTVGLLIAGLLGEVDWALVANKPWFALPQLFPYGGPGFGWTFAVAAIAAIFAGYLGSIVESLGDYAATCAVAGEVYHERHMNRGILAEGLGGVAAVCLGGLPCTSYTQNIGIIATTRVASRHVVRLAAVILILYGLCPKLGALLVAMPRSVLGGVFIVVCGMIASAGIRLIATAAPTPASSLTIGTTLIAAVGVPAYVRTGLGEPWLAGLPDLLALCLTNSVAIAVVLGVGLNFVLNAAWHRG